MILKASEHEVMMKRLKCEVKRNKKMIMQEKAKSLQGWSDRATTILSLTQKVSALSAAGVPYYRSA